MNSFWDGETTAGTALRTGTLRPGRDNELDPAIDRAVNLNTPEELERERKAIGTTPAPRTEEECA
jgi:hypothetical protein